MPSPEEKDPQLHLIHSEMERGVDPDVLRDIGFDVAEGAEAETPRPFDPEDEMDLLEMLEERAEKDAINTNSRKTYLIQLIKEVGTQRRMEGFAVNHERTPDTDEYRSNVEAKNYTTQLEGKETLDRACGVCAWAGNCAIQNDIAAWTATHPYAKTDNKLPYSWQRFPKVRRAESRMKLLKRLDRDPLAHCIPEDEDDLPSAA